MQTPETLKDYLATYRASGLQDATFAIVMTLLVLEIRVPDLLSPKNPGELLWELLDMWPVIVSYFSSFVLLGIQWIGMYIQYHYINNVDRILLWMLIAYLAMVSLVPFTTALVGHYWENPLAVVLYGAHLAMLSILATVHWRYATHNHRLVEHHTPDSLVHKLTRRTLLCAFVSLAAMALAFVNVEISIVLYFFIIVYYMMPGRIDKYWQRPSRPHKH